MNAPLFPNMIYARKFIASILEAVFIGLAVASGVSLFVMPMSSRNVVNKELNNLLVSLKSCLAAFKTLIHSFTDYEVMASMLVADRTPSEPIRMARSTIKEASTLHSKMQLDLPFAKREIGFGLLNADHLKKLNQLLNSVLLPTAGLESVTGLFQYFATVRGWTEESIKHLNEEEQAQREKGVREWMSNMELVKEPVDNIIDLMTDALDHIIIRLRLKAMPKQPKTGPVASQDSDDVEASAGSNPTTTGCAPGESGFAAHFDEESNRFYNEKHVTLIEWGRRRGITWPDNFFDRPDSTPFGMSEEMKAEGENRRQKNQRQLYLLLYVSSFPLPNLLIT
jgi:hypothetical protein